MLDAGEAGGLSAWDSTYFLPSDIRRRGMSVANAGTRAISISNCIELVLNSFIPMLCNVI